MSKARTTKKAPVEETTPQNGSPRGWNLNRCQLVGRLTADPELRYAPSGMAIAKFRIATNDTKEAQFHTVTVFGEPAEQAAEALHKADAVSCEGRLRYAQWTASDGSKRLSVEIVAQAVTAYSVPE